MPNIGVIGLVGGALLLTTLVSVFGGQSSYVCPKRFVPIGKKCYHFSKDEAIWYDAHFRCTGLNSSLAVVTKSHQELILRRYLNRRAEGKYERWLGGTFNEKTSRWIWGQNGKPLVFHGFSRMNARDQKWAWHCIIVDPSRQNKWSARSCLSKKRYICMRAAYRIKNFNNSKCINNGTVTDLAQKKLCSKNSFGKIAPENLMKRPKQVNQPYHPTTFICPSHMILVGRKCYFFSNDEANWSDAYWACRDNKTKLANIVTRMQDNILRGFLNGNFTERHERWTGGIYDWKQMKWRWAISGKVIRYKNFAKGVIENRNHTQHCITLDPELNHWWNSKNRLERKYYICQAKAKSVVKYDKYYKPHKQLNPDATVIIQVDIPNDVTGSNITNHVSTLATRVDYKSVTTEKYIYN